MKNVLLLILTALIVTSSSSCVFSNLIACSNPDVHFILPDKYIGPFRITLDENQGMDVNLENGRYIYRIPETGELKVKSLQPFMGCHKERAAYQGGEEIPNATSTDNPDTIALRGSMGSGSKEVGGRNIGPVILTYIIGTKEQEGLIKSPTYSGTMRNVNSTPQP